MKIALRNTMVNTINKNFKKKTFLKVCGYINNCTLKLSDKSKLLVMILAVTNFKCIAYMIAKKLYRLN